MEVGCSNVAIRGAFLVLFSFTESGFVCLSRAVLFVASEKKKVRSVGLLHLCACVVPRLLLPYANFVKKLVLF